MRTSVLLVLSVAFLLHPLAAGHQTSPLLATILVRTAEPSAVARRLRALTPRYPGLRVSDRASVATVTDADRETNRWLGPLFVAIIFAFTSIAVINTLVMIGLGRGRELAREQVAPVIALRESPRHQPPGPDLPGEPPALALASGQPHRDGPQKRLGVRDRDGQVAAGHGPDHER